MDSNDNPQQLPPLVVELKHLIRTLLNPSDPAINIWTRQEIVRILSIGDGNVAKYVAGRLRDERIRLELKELILGAVKSTRNSHRLIECCGWAMRDSLRPVAETAMEILFEVGTEKSLSILVNLLSEKETFAHQEHLKAIALKKVEEMAKRMEGGSLELHKSDYAQLDTLAYISARTIGNSFGFEFKKEILGLIETKGKYRGYAESILAIDPEIREYVAECLAKADQNIVAKCILERINCPKDLEDLKHILDRIDRQILLKKMIGHLSFCPECVCPNIREMILKVAKESEENELVAARSLLIAIERGNHVENYESVLAELENRSIVEATLGIIETESKKRTANYSKLVLQRISESDPHSTSLAFMGILHGKKIIGRDHTITIKRIADSETESQLRSIAKKSLEEYDSDLRWNRNAFMKKMRKVRDVLTTPITLRKRNNC